MNLLPSLGNGVVVHLHDIFRPFDYPPGWNDRYYSEQYLLLVSLGAYLLNAGAATPKVLLPNAFIVHDLGLG
jgi:hypothetical protein